MPPITADQGLHWAWLRLPRPVRAARPMLRPLLPHAAEMPARHYLARRGGSPMAAQPLARALPLLLRELAQERREAWRDLALALAMLAAALGLGLSALGEAPAEPLLAALQHWLHPAVAAAGAGWAALVLARAVPRLRRARQLGRLLRRGAWAMAFRAAG